MSNDLSLLVLRCMEVGHFNVHILITSEILSKMLYFCRNAFKFVTCEYQMTHTLAKMTKQMVGRRV